MRRIATWALVTDGVRARILRDLERAGKPPPELLRKSSMPRIRAFLSAPEPDPIAWRPDRDRRVGSGSGSEPVRSDMRDFCDRIAGELLEQHRSGAFRRLAVFAGPTVLEVFRDIMPTGLGRTICCAIAPDLMNLSETALRREIRAILRREALI